MQYNIVKKTDVTVVTVYVEGRDPLVASSATHPQFDKVLALIVADDESVVEVMDLALAASKKFRALSERVSVKGTKVFIDGDPVDNSVTKQVGRFLAEDVDDWKALVAFIEKVYANPQVHSREQLFTFLDANQFSIDEDGDIIGYKGVKATQPGSDKQYESTHSGTAIVNGEEITGRIPQSIGDTVEMPRSKVAHDPNTACSVGLHIASHDYAKGYGSKVIAVKVNPRDVVSVPNDAGAKKVRACRYTAITEVSGPYDKALVIGEKPAPAGSLAEHAGDPVPAKPVTPTSNPAPTPEVPGPEAFPPVVTSDGTIPGRTAWAKMNTLAKGQRKSLKAVVSIPSRRWTLIGDDPTNREHWRVPNSG